MSEQQMVQYVVNGGKLFTVNLIDIIRDGGTVLVKTTKDSYFIDKDNKKLHYNYPTTDSNIINDSLLIEYIIGRIVTYIKKCEEDVERYKNLLIEIQK